VREPLPIGQSATLACIWEATAPKPGNVHPQAAFVDVCYADYLASAVAIGPAMERAAMQGVGLTVLEAVEATRWWVGRNTNLGTILLLAPLASVPRNEELRSGIATRLAALDADDAARIYEAICLARPGGIGETQEMDVQGPPPSDLLAAMRQAAERDLVAHQYVEDFASLFDEVIPALQAAIEEGIPLSAAIVHVHLQTLKAFPDSLIARKCGQEVANEASRRAGKVLSAGPVGSGDYQTAVRALDAFLRADGHRRNPGTSADMVAAALFSLLRDGIITDAQGFSIPLQAAGRSDLYEGHDV